MKKILLAAVSLSALAGSAFAADLPSRKEAILPPPPPPMWTGMYAGLNAGYNWGVNTNSYSQNWGTPSAQLPGYTPTAPIAMDGVASMTQSGFIGGAQFGYNYQYGSSIVLGVETDIQGTNTRGSGRTSGAVNDGPVTIGAITASGSTVGATAIQGGVDYLGTIRGRIVYLWSPTLLVYGTGGFAYGGAYANVVQTAASAGSRQVSVATPVAGSALWIGGGQQNQLLTGWTAGAGLEWMFMPNWSLKGEALYWDLGRMNVNTISYLSTGDTLGWGRTNVNYSGVMARAGVNYHFNFGAAPVVAKF